MPASDLVHQQHRQSKAAGSVGFDVVTLNSFLSDVRGRPELRRIEEQHHHCAAEERGIHADALEIDEEEECGRDDFSMRFQGCIDDCKDLSPYILRASHTIPRHSIFYRSSYQKSLGLPPTHALIKVTCIATAAHLRSWCPLIL